MPMGPIEFAIAICTKSMPLKLSEATSAATVSGCWTQKMSIMSAEQVQMTSVSM